MYLSNTLNNTGRAVMTAPSPFSPTWLTANGFTFMGNCWGNHNSPYWQMETEIGTICVVSYREVWLERGHREQRLEKIDCEKMLGLFIGMLS